MNGNNKGKRGRNGRRPTKTYLKAVIFFRTYKHPTGGEKWFLALVVSYGGASAGQTGRRRKAEGWYT